MLVMFKFLQQHHRKYYSIKEDDLLQPLDGSRLHQNHPQATLTCVRKE
jgi:hypothetical protein